MILVILYLFAFNIQSQVGAEVLVRLVHGGIPHAGTVELFYDGQWGTVCDDGWDINDATVVCRQLGYTAAYQALMNAQYGQGSGPILLDDVDCTGQESNIDECDHRGWNMHNCRHSEDAGVVCNLDNILPQILCPANLTVDTNSGENRATVSLPAAASRSASDNSSGSYTVTVNIDGLTYNVQDSVDFGVATTPHLVRYTVTDSVGNSATCAMYITVVDKTPPTFITGCPGNINHNVDIGVIGPASVEWPVVTASDPGLPLLWNSSHQPGDMFPIGNVTMVTYTVTDRDGNSANCSFSVTVTEVGLECPVNTTVTAVTNPGSAFANVTWMPPDVVFSGTKQDVYYLKNPSQDDTNRGGVLVSSNYQPGDTFTIGVTVVAYHIQGLEIQCQIDVIVIDNEPPEVYDCPDDVIIPVASLSDLAHHSWTPPVISDNSGQTNVTFGCLATSSVECNQTGSGTFPVGVATVTYSATDMSGNENGCSFTVKITVVDMICPANITALAHPGSNETRVQWQVPDLTGWDAGSTNFTSGAFPGDLFPIGMHRVSYRQWFAQHGLGLECSFFVMVVGRCVPETTADGITWSATTAGSTAQSVERCPLRTLNAGQPLAVRNCSTLERPVYFQWDDTELHSCGEVADKVDLKDVVKVPVSPGNAVEVAEFLAIQTSESADDVADNVEVISSILANIVSAGSGNPKVTELVLETVDSVIMNVKANPSSSPDGNSSSSIIRSVESQIALTLQQKDEVTIRQESIHVEAVSLDPRQARNGFQFASMRPKLSDFRPGQGSPLDGSKVQTFANSKEIPKDTVVLASASLPGNIIDLLQSGEGNSSAKLQVSFIIYADDTLFQSALIRETQQRNGTNRTVAGSVVSLSVQGVDLVNLTEPVVIGFKTPEDDQSSIQCVFWDFGLKDRVGDWSTAGCVLAGVTNETVSCNCNHATNFAILLDVKGQANRKKSPAEHALDVISQVGCVLSIIALAITLIIYLSIRKLRAGKSRQIFIHFCMSLMLLYIVFITGVDNAKGAGGGCVFVAVLLHYLTLTSMMWMAVEARNMYATRVKVFPEYTPRYMLKASLIAWGFPVIVLVICLASASDHYRNEYYCFLRPDLVLYLGLLVPIGLILIHNVITFILVMRSLLKLKEVSRSQQITKRLQNAVGISTLLGLTWCFGFLAINEARFAFQLIFSLVNSLQGVIVFILFCIRRDDVRSAVAPYMRRMLCCCNSTSLLPKSQITDRADDAEMASKSVTTSPSTMQMVTSGVSISEAQ